MVNVWGLFPNLQLYFTTFCCVFARLSEKKWRKNERILSGLISPLAERGLLCIPSRLLSPQPPVTRQSGALYDTIARRQSSSLLPLVRLISPYWFNIKSRLDDVHALGKLFLTSAPAAPRLGVRSRGFYTLFLLTLFLHLSLFTTFLQMWQCDRNIRNFHVSVYIGSLMYLVESRNFTKFNTPRGKQPEHIV